MEPLVSDLWKSENLESIDKKSVVWLEFSIHTFTVTIKKKCIIHSPKRQVK